MSGEVVDACFGEEATVEPLADVMRSLGITNEDVAETMPPRPEEER